MTRHRKLLVSATLLSFLCGFGAVAAVPAVGHGAVITIGHVKRIHRKPHRRRHKHRRHHHKKA